MEKICEECRQSYKTDRWQRRFCSNSCSSRNNHRTNPKMQAAAQRFTAGGARARAEGKLDAWQKDPRNPIYDPIVRQRAQQSMAGRYGEILNGGNGTGMSNAQKALAQVLVGWIPEYVVTTGMGKPKQGMSIPGHYKIDLANPSLGIAVEVDGKSHRAKKVQEADARKTAYLESRGWTCIRFWNKEVEQDLQAVVSSILQLVHTITSPGVS